MASKRTFTVTSGQSSQRGAGQKGGGGGGGRRRGRSESKQKLSHSLGEAAREARRRAGLTQADVAERIGVATEVYGRMERGMIMPSVPTLRRLCMALGTPADWLLGLGSGPTAAWAQVLPATQDPPAFRRLVRTLRKLQAPQLRALGLTASAMLRDS